MPFFSHSIVLKRWRFISSFEAPSSTECQKRPSNSIAKFLEGTNTSNSRGAIAVLSLHLVSFTKLFTYSCNSCSGIDVPESFFKPKSSFSS